MNSGFAAWSLVTDLLTDRTRGFVDGHPRNCKHQSRKKLTYFDWFEAGSFSEYIRIVRYLTLRPEVMSHRKNVTLNIIIRPDVTHFRRDRKCRFSVRLFRSKNAIVKPEVTTVIHDALLSTRKNEILKTDVTFFRYDVTSNRKIIFQTGSNDLHIRHRLRKIMRFLNRS